MQAHNTEPNWDALYASAEFSDLVKHRKRIIITLMGISMALFFSIPLIAHYAAWLFKLQIFGVINLGLVYLMFQYVMGSVIAWQYARRLKTIDAQVDALLAH